MVSGPFRKIKTSNGGKAEQSWGGGWRDDSAKSWIIRSIASRRWFTPTKKRATLPTLSTPRARYGSGPVLAITNDEKGSTGLVP